MIKAINDSLSLRWPGGGLQGLAHLPASKSESNRALILHALAGGGRLRNLSDAHDTQLMRSLLAAAPGTDRLSAEDAGTVMRFLTAYLTVTGWHGELTGTPRMQERPIAVLVGALRQAGADLAYAGHEGFPPLRLHGFAPATAAGEGPTRLSVRGDVSSQYISALLMVGPYLPGGLELALTGPVGSRPYIEMTLALMARFGAACTTNADATRLVVPAGRYHAADYAVESDWSAASYWYALVALGPPGSEITLPGLRQHSLQGDQAVAGLMTHFGVETTYLPAGEAVRLRQVPCAAPDGLRLDFTDCPDLAQTVAVVAAALAWPVDMRGLESLRIKETDRIAALQTELGKFGGGLQEVEEGVFRVVSAGFRVDNQSVATYHDHRMAMAFAPLALRGPLVVEAPQVVRKSYPQFWKELAAAGFVIGEAG